MWSVCTQVLITPVQTKLRGLSPCTVRSGAAEIPKGDPSKGWLAGHSLGLPRWTTKPMESLRLWAQEGAKEKISIFMDTMGCWLASSAVRAGGTRLVFTFEIMS